MYSNPGANTEANLSQSKWLFDGNRSRQEEERVMDARTASKGGSCASPLRFPNIY